MLWLQSYDVWVIQQVLEVKPRRLILDIFHNINPIFIFFMRLFLYKNGVGYQTYYTEYVKKDSLHHLRDTGQMVKVGDAGAVRS